MEPSGTSFGMFVRLKVILWVSSGICMCLVYAETGYVSRFIIIN